MKRHISIFTFLLGALAVGFATEAVANQQSIFADGYWQPGKAELTYANDYLTPEIGYVYPPDSGNENQNVFTVGFKSGWTVDHWRQNTESFLYSDGTKIKGTDGLVTYTCPYSGSDNIYLAVKFKYIKYNVTYNANGGSPTPESVLNQSYDAYFDLAAAPTKTGYTFKSWKASSNEKKTFTAGESVRGSTLGLGACHVDGSNVTMTAQWTANTYTVTFDANGGGSPDPDSTTVTYGKAYGDLATCSRAGYTFDGWYTEESGGTQIETTNKVAITANQTLYAHWTANTYTVTIDPNGGTGGSCPSYTVSTNQQTKTVTKPTRTGYSISKWTVTGATGGTPTVSGTKLTIPANVYGNLTLKPSWTPITYTITYTGNKAAHSNPSTYTIESEKIVFTRPADVVGFKFIGWEPASIAKGSTGNKTVTANYLTKVDPPVAKTPLTYNGSVQSCASSTVQYQATDNQQTLPGQYTATFTLYPGYCWNDENESVTPCSVPWEIRNADLSNVSVKQSGSLVYTGKPQTPTVFHQATTVGQKTVTWTYSASGSDFSPAVPSFTEIGEHTVYYRAEAEYHNTAEGPFIVTIEDSRYTIEFDGGAGAEGSMEPVSLIHDEPYVVENAFTKKGCEFVTWRTVIGGVATNFDVGATVSNLSAEAGTVITFTADWLGRYTVAFDGNGGEGTMTNVTYEEDREYRLPSNAFTRSGYHFTGWATNGTEVVFTDGAAVSNLAAPGETCTLVAQWKEITLGEAMHCNDTNLVWESKSYYPVSVNEWTPEVGANIGYDGDSCVQQIGAGGNLGKQQWLQTQVSTNGHLSFKWKPSGENGEIAVTITTKTAVPGKGEYEQISCMSSEWQTYETDIPKGYYVKIANSGSSTCSIDQMTWVPEGSEPKQGDPVAATAAGIEDGVFSLTIKTVSGIEYGVWTNADLTVPAENWGLMGETQKAKGDSLKFEWTILPGFPQLFFRAYKVDYK